MFGGLELNKKKMGAISSLSKLSGIKAKSSSIDKEDFQENIDQIDENAEIIDELPINHLDSKDINQTSSTEDSKKQEIEKKQITPKQSQNNISKNKKISKKKKNSKQVSINIKIRKDQKDWLADTAFIVRENNLEAVPPIERVYPQHLIGIAIDLLQNTEIDWEQIKNINELREQLNL